MHPPGSDTVLVRYGEVNTKSQSVRTAMLEHLHEHLEGLLSHRSIPGRIERERGRIYVQTEDSRVEDAARAAAAAFGVTSTSPTLEIPPNRAAIEAALRRTAASVYEGAPFAVRARRAGDEHPFTSEDVERFGGSAVFDGAPEGVDPTVDLDDPSITFHVEIRPDAAYVFLSEYDGPGGLPYGTQAPVVGLLSGGIDSPVAVYECCRRGIPVVPAYIGLGDYGGPDHEARAVETVRRLAGHVPHDEWGLYRVPSGESVDRIAASMDRGRMLALRRYMLRVAEHLADREDAAGIATGEAVGQKSSQTTSNIAATDSATEYPVHRPLVTADKSTITQRARTIGTFHDSTIPTGCNRFAPSTPETNASIEWIRGAEPDELFDWAREDAADAEWIPVDPVSPEAISPETSQ